MIYLGTPIKFLSLNNLQPGFSFNNNLILPSLVEVTGIEPATYCVQGSCSPC
jgi:hypothetical protein